MSACSAGFVFAIVLRGFYRLVLCVIFEEEGGPALGAGGAIQEVVCPCCLLIHGTTLFVFFALRCLLMFRIRTSLLVPIFVFTCSLHNEWNIRAALPGGLFVRKYDTAIIDYAKVLSPSA